MMKITMGKCWQSGYGAIVFQCSTHDGTTRQKGYLELNPAKNDSPVAFTLDKPAGDLAPKGVATLIRKYLDTGSLTAMALSPPGAAGEFIRLTFHGKTSAGDPSEIMLVITTRPDREITLLTNNKSLARLRETSSYTVAKPAPGEFTGVEDLSADGFQAWLMSCFAGNPSSAGEKTSSESSADATQELLPQLPPQLLPPWRRAARERVARRLKTLKKTLTQDQGKVPVLQDVLRAKQDAELLRSFLWMIKPDAIELSLDSSQTGDTARVISLDPDKTPGANLEGLFKKIKKLEKAIHLGSPRVAEMADAIIRFEDALVKLRTPETRLTEQDVTAILRDLGLERAAASQTSTKTSSAKNTTPGRRFQSAEGHVILIGRNADESDKLVKLARSQDWWLHVAGGGHGSHVIINGNPFKTGLPQKLTREAAILALHFSDRSASREGEVYVARRHQIKKRKGMAAGLWHIERAEAIVVRYEPDELRDIFAREIREGVQRRYEPGTQ